MEISILVSTKNRKKQVIEFLSRLNRIDQEPKWELILIDNGSSDGTSEAIGQFDNSFPLVLLQEKLPGKSRALNKGIEHANGDLLMFTDDDIIPDRHWIRAMYAASHQNKDKYIFGGRIKIDSDLLPKWISSSYNLKGILSSEHDFGDSSFIYPASKYPIGPNMAVRKSLVTDSKGLWPVHLGPGTKLPLGDERGFFESLYYGKGIDRLHVAESIVWHVPEMEQLVFIQAVKRCYQCGFVHGQLDATNELIGNNFVSVSSLISARLRTCKSLREFCCITIRSLGVVNGKLCNK